MTAHDRFLIDFLPFRRVTQMVLASSAVRAWKQNIS